MEVQLSPFNSPHLPIEIKKYILSKLPPFDLITKANLVCREWHSAANDPMTWRYIESEAQPENLEKIRQLALIYLVGKNQPRNEELGFALAERFADQICSRELISPAERLLFGLSRVQATSSEPLLEMIKSAFAELPGLNALLAEENAFVLYLKAVSHFDIDNPMESAPYLMSSAEQNFTSALCALASFEPSYIDKLAEIKTPAAQFFAYLIAKNSASGPTNKVLEGLVESAENNFSMSQFTLAMHLKNQGRADESLKWALKAAMQGHVQAQYYIGQNCHSLEIDLTAHEEAWIAEAIKAGENQIYFYLGKISAANLKDLDKTDRSLFKSINLGLDIPLYQWTFFPALLYRLYKNGCKVEKSEEKALGYYNQLKNMDPKFARQMQKSLEAK